MAKKIVLPPTRPNAGFEIAYQKKIDAMIEEMQRSVEWWLTAAYKANKPEMATDADSDTAKTAAQKIAKAIQKNGSPAKVLQDVVAKLDKIWTRKFDDNAQALAKYFATSMAKRTDAQLRAALKKVGFAVEFKLTSKMNDVLQATIAENVSLIKSIQSQYFTDIEGIVMRSVQRGFKMDELSSELQKRYGVTRRRAALISRDQTNKANANITVVRQRELGITRAIWLHSAGGKEPRHSHVAASGKEYDIDKGMLIDGEYIFPGQLINCRCVSKSVIPGLPNRS